MVIEMFVFKCYETLFDFLRCGLAWWKPPLSVGSDTCPEQFIITVGDDSRIGDMKQLSGKTKDISNQQESKDAKHYFPEY